MSADYPNRGDWLAKRETPRGIVHGKMVWANGTYSNGRRQEKSRRWSLKLRNRAERHAAKKAA